MATSSNSTTSAIRISARRRGVTVLGLAFAGVALLGACSAESLLEEGIERATDIEEVNIGEDGITFEDNGETVEFGLDDQGGSMTVTDAEGNTSGLEVAMDESGGGQLTIDENGQRETYTAKTNDEGLVIANGNNEEILVVDAGGTTEAPSWYPADLPLPQGAMIMNSINLGDLATLSGTAPHSPNDTATRFAEDAANAGWTIDETLSTVIAEVVSLSHPEGRAVNATFAISEDASQTNFNMQVTKAN